MAPLTGPLVCNEVLLEEEDYDDAENWMVLRIIRPVVLNFPVIDNSGRLGAISRTFYREFTVRIPLPPHLPALPIIGFHHSLFDHTFITTGQRTVASSGGGDEYIDKENWDPNVVRH